MLSFTSSTHYDTLRIPRQATKADIQRAYKVAALREYPDKNPQRITEATERFKVINAAYEVLFDDTKGAKYDASLPRLKANMGPSFYGENTASYSNGRPCPYPRPWPSYSTPKQPPRPEEYTAWRPFRGPHDDYYVPTAPYLVSSPHFPGFSRRMETFNNSLRTGTNTRDKAGTRNRAGCDRGHTACEGA